MLDAARPVPGLLDDLADRRGRAVLARVDVARKVGTEADGLARHQLLDPNGRCEEVGDCAPVAQDTGDCLDHAEAEHHQWAQLRSLDTEQ